MKKKFKKLWNNRRFRTFLQTFISTLVAYIIENQMNLDGNIILYGIIIALSTGLSIIMPLMNEEEE